MESWPGWGAGDSGASVAALMKSASEGPL
jgi:hypothetical protein